MDEPECSNRVEASEHSWQAKFEELFDVHHQKMERLDRLERKLASYDKALMGRGYGKVSPYDAFKDFDRIRAEFDILQKQIASGELVTPDQLGEIDISQLRTNATPAEVQVDALNVQLEILKNALKEAEESQRLSMEQCKEVLAELADEREKSVELISLLKIVQEAYYQTGYKANLLEVEIQKVNKQMERFEQEVFERNDVDSVAQDARIARLSRLMAIKDAVESVGESSRSGHRSPSVSPPPEPSGLVTRRQNPRQAPSRPPARRVTRGRTRPSASRWFQS